MKMRILTRFADSFTSFKEGLQLEKIEGIVIKTQEYKEKDKLLWIFTRTYGKVSLVAHSAKKSSSHLSACTQRFTYGLYVFTWRSGLSTLRSGEILNNFNMIKTNLWKTAYASYLLELIDKGIHDGEQHPYVYEWLFRILQKIDEDEDAEILIRIFEMKMTEVFGIQPNVESCVHCNSCENLVGFTVADGGFLCGNCFVLSQDAILYPPAVLHLLYLFSKIGPKQIGNISVKQETKNMLKKILYDYLDRHTGIFFNSRKFIEELDLL